MQPPAWDPATAQRPILVAHRAGESRRALRAALAAGVDWLEVDLWSHYGRVVSRHDAALGRLPITYHSWRAGVLLRPPLTLDALLDAVDGTPVRLLLDLKGNAADLPRRIVETLQRREAVSRAALCGQDWRPLDAARGLEPALSVCFSLGREEHLPAYLRRLDEGSAPSVISIAHRLLTEQRLRELHDRGVTTLCWTVDQPSRARQLVDWGADGIISNSPALLRGLRPDAERT